VSEFIVQQGSETYDKVLRVEIYRVVEASTLEPVSREFFTEEAALEYLALVEQDVFTTESEEHFLADSGNLEDLGGW